jgi:hypothetical protein
VTVNRLNHDEFRQATGPYHDGDHRILGRMFYNRQQGYYARPSGTVVDLVNMPGATVTPEGTATNADDADGAWTRWATSTTNDSDAGPTLTPATVFARPSWGIEARAWVRFQTSVATMRAWVGCVASDPMGSSDPAIHGAAFRYDTGAGIDTTAFWRCWTNDGSGAGSVTITTVPIALATKYDLRIKVEALQGAIPNKVMFFINDTLVATHMTNLPGATGTPYVMPWAQVRHIVAGGTASAIEINQFIFNSQPIR